MSKKSERETRPDEENPEWTRAMFKQAKLAPEALPASIGSVATDALMKRKLGRPASGERRVARTFRLPKDVVAAYEATGTTWRQLVAQVLREHMPGRK